MQLAAVKEPSLHKGLERPRFTWERFPASLVELVTQPALFSCALCSKVQKLLTTYDLFQNEGELWTGKTGEFMKPRSGENKEAKQKRLRAKTDTRDRVPTFKWLQCVHGGPEVPGLPERALR